MFSGKTEELIRRVKRAIIARQNVQIFKPSLDDRYGIDRVKSHNGAEIKAVAVENSSEILILLEDGTTVVAIDEAQFLDKDIVDVVRELSERNVRVIIAGLDTDFRHEPFGFMPNLLCVAEEVLKLHAICVICAEAATRTQRIVNGQPAFYEDPIVVVGAQESYEARCPDHHVVPRREDMKVSSP